MKNSIYELISKSTAHRKSREENRKLILENPKLMSDMIAFCFLISDKNHHKACWTMELVAEANISLFYSHIDFICDNISTIKNESALRSISGIVLQIVRDYDKKNPSLLNDIAIENISSCAFDWLIKDLKIATKAHAMKILFITGKKYDWIYPDLKSILIQDAHRHSAGYISCAKNILKKIN